MTNDIEVDQAKKVIAFILSSDYSGSTWTGYVLGSNTESAFLGEFWRAWDPVFRLPCSWCAANGKPVCEVLGHLETVPAAEAFETAFSRIPKRVLIDSSKQIEWAKRFLPPNAHYEIRLIHLIRDPRGWYASQRQRGRVSLEPLLAQWLTENVCIRNFIQLSGISSTTVFYEELAENPEQQFRKLSGFLGLPFSPASLRYWELPHHGFAANGASSLLLAKAPAHSVSKLGHFRVNEESFYKQQGGNSFVDRRWKQQLSAQEIATITEDPEVAALLSLYGRVLGPDSLIEIRNDLRLLHQALEGRFIRADSNGSAPAKVYLVRNGRRHWVMNSRFLSHFGARWPDDVETVSAECLHHLPPGPDCHVDETLASTV